MREDSYSKLHRPLSPLLLFPFLLLQPLSAKQPDSQGMQSPGFHCGDLPTLSLLVPALPLPVLLLPSAPSLPVCETLFRFPFWPGLMAALPSFACTSTAELSPSQAAHPSSACFCAVWTNSPEALS